LGRTVNVDVNGVVVRGGPSISYGAVGSQNSNVMGGVIESCLQDTASSKVFCHINFAINPDGWVPTEDLLVQPISNPIDDVQTFVGRQYYDFLNRDPDSQGFDYWTSQVAQCGADVRCIHDRRVSTADAFFFEPEFQQTGSFVYRAYKAAFGARPSFAEFNADRDMVIVGPGLDQSKTDLVLNFVQRSTFLLKYPRTQTAQQFIDNLLTSLLVHSGVDLWAQRNTLIGFYNGTDFGRVAILRAVADNQAFVDAEYNNSFVLMEYFGYLGRDPDEAGFQFWLSQVNSHPLRNTSVQQAMACSFITSAEYQLRFGTVITRSNSECPQ